MRKTLARTTDYINSISFKELPWFFFSCIFLGWNGIQIVFSLSLILTFIDSRSMTNLVFNSMRYYSRVVPIYIFALLTFFVIHLFLHCLFEVSLSAKIQKAKLKLSEIQVIAINFFIPTLLLILTIFLIAGLVFLAIVFSNVVSSGFAANLDIAVEYSFYRWLYISVIMSFLVTVLLVDNVLPRMTKEHSFKIALCRAYIYFRNNLWQLSIFYLLKLTLILFSVFVFQSILRHFLLPGFLMLEDNFSFSLFLMSGRTINFQHIISNIFMLYAIISAAFIVFTPIMAFPYMYQRLLLYKYTKR